MRAAIRAVTTNELTQNEATRRYCVPVATLNHRIKCGKGENTEIEQEEPGKHTENEQDDPMEYNRREQHEPGEYNGREDKNPISMLKENK
ncbi:unnamed protein product [Ceutorhynchus assimilis]|uniref:HTH psq-type domain-containing protein n=1 Tax=Ceutorhynchus assimilis TaxID=467358 RepID=A0A9N9MH51_9CUCU|nr:unnamed protein product [Ceutorhynchus assimilis]